ncbi:hypothetical protein KQX54_018175 [Cotesia glomerata]|uniref:Uncharacterized protein n=1 Tax=Cotesia glomerata TaxID=32391 RepID=A0AAV7I0I7_COTGL|nr:hypothetical protein KQX54_018175 [Cotesia glomerata]
MLRAELLPARVKARMLLEDEHPSSVTDPNKLWNRVELGQERERGLPRYSNLLICTVLSKCWYQYTCVRLYWYRCIPAELAGWWGSDRLRLRPALLHYCTVLEVEVEVELKERVKRGRGVRVESRERVSKGMGMSMSIAGRVDCSS